MSQILHWVVEHWEQVTALLTSVGALVGIWFGWRKTWPALDVFVNLEVQTSIAMDFSHYDHGFLCAKLINNSKIDIYCENLEVRAENPTKGATARTETISIRKPVRASGELKEPLSNVVKTPLPDQVPIEIIVRMRATLRAYRKSRLTKWRTFSVRYSEKADKAVQESPRFHDRLHFWRIG